MSDLLQQICEIMENHRGKNNQISAGKISEILNLRMEDTHAEARGLIRQAIEKFGIPIIAGGRGYYIANTQEELDTYIKRLENRIIEIEKRKNLIISTFNAYNSKK